MIGVAVGLGNVWRFPYMVGQFGGAAFVATYLAIAVLIGIPALMAEWALGRHTRRGTLGAFERAGLPGGRWLGWILFGAVTAAAAYYCVAVGWVLYHLLGQAATLLAIPLDASRVLPPESGFDAGSMARQVAMTGIVVLGCVGVLLQGLRAGIERVSRLVMPILLVILLVLIARSVTLDGAWEGIRWYLAFEPSAIRGGVVLAALGQVVFSIGLGGTLMVVYGSYLNEADGLAGNALWTVAGDTGAGLLAGLAIFPAAFALGLEPGSGPGLIFSTLPEVFARLPAGAVFGTLFFGALLGAAYLSAVAALEVLVAGLTDNTSLSRRSATWTMAAVVMALALPPMVNLGVFVPWDLTFGSGMLTFGALVAAVTVGWSLDRGAALRALAGESTSRFWKLLHLWVRFVIPGAILAVGAWWLATEVLGGG